MKLRTVALTAMVGVVGLSGVASGRRRISFSPR